MASLTSLALPPSGIREALKRAMFTHLVPVVRSSPGLGKSDIAQSLADEFNLLLVDFRLGQADLTDLNGLPRFRADGRAEFAPFDVFPLEGDALPINPKTNQPYAGWLLFFDEITSAAKQIQACAYKILLDRKIGNRKLHPNVAMMAAGNGEGDNAVVFAMSTALQSRLIHLDLELSKDEWMEWAFTHDIDHRVIAYIEFRPQQLLQFDPNHQDKTFACPRTWAFASRLIRNRPSLDNIDAALLAGTISIGIAHEFVEFTRVFDSLPKIDEIITAPQSCRLPHEPSVKYALTAVLAEAMDDTNVDELIQYLMRFPAEHRVLCLRLALARKPYLTRHKSVDELFKKLAMRMMGK